MCEQKVVEVKDTEEIKIQIGVDRRKFTVPGCKHSLCYSCLKGYGKALTGNAILVLNDYKSDTYKEWQCPVRQCKSMIDAHKCLSLFYSPETINCIKLAARGKLFETVSIDANVVPDPQPIPEVIIVPNTKCIDCDSTDLYIERFTRCKNDCDFALCRKCAIIQTKDLKESGIVKTNIYI